MSSRGHNRERAVRKNLESRGWLVVRAAGSLGPVDLVALPKVELREQGILAPMLVEVKSTAGGPYERFGPADRQELADLALSVGGIAVLAWQPPRGALAWIPSTDWPSRKGTGEPTQN